MYYLVDPDDVSYGGSKTGKVLYYACLGYNSTGEYGVVSGSIF